MKIHEFFDDKNCFYIVMDRLSGGELFDKIVEKQRDNKPYTEQQSAKIIYQVLQALNYCHKNKIVHRYFC